MYSHRTKLNYNLHLLCGLCCEQGVTPELKIKLYNTVSMFYFPYVLLVWTAAAGKCLHEKTSIRIMKKQSCAAARVPLESLAMTWLSSVIIHSRNGISRSHNTNRVIQEATSLRTPSHTPTRTHQALHPWFPCLRMGSKFRSADTHSNRRWQWSRFITH